MKYTQKTPVLETVLVKKSFKPSHLELRYKTYYAVLDIPKDVQYIIGKKKYFKTTKTGNLKAAEAITAIWVMQWKAEIESARSKSDEPIIQSALELRKMRKTTAKHLLDDVIDDETIRIESENSPMVAGIFKDIATGEQKYLKEMIDGWEKHQKDRGLADKNIDQMKSDINLLVETFVTAKLMTPEHVNNWIKYTANNDKKKLSASSVNRIIGSGRNFFKYLQLVKEVKSTLPDPFVVPIEFKISKGSNSKSINKVKSWLPFDPEDVVALYKNALASEEEKMADLIYIGMFTGARIEEICSLLCKDIDIKGESITITDAKTDAGVREIPIHKELKSRLKKLIELSTDDYLISGLTKNKYGDRSNAIGKKFGRMKKKLNYSDRHVFHSIRKTFTTLLENAGVGENITADIVGHEKPRITYGLYSGGASLKTMANAINRISYKFD